MKKLIYLCFLIATNELYTAEGKKKPQTEQGKLAAFIKENPGLAAKDMIRWCALEEAFKEFDQIRAQDPEQSQNIVSSVRPDSRLLKGPQVVKGRCGRDRGTIYYCSECGRKKGIYEEEAAAQRHVNRPHKDGNLQED